MTWTTRKKDAAPRGVRRHESGVWGIRYTCGAGHLHKEKIGPIKGDAIRTYHDRRARAQDEPGWCPAVERGHARAEASKAKARSTFREYAEDYLKWAEPQSTLEHRGEQIPVSVRRGARH